ncbi:diguanylate cyclase [Hydrococcus rivularis NIES-593]|uniref:Diguanylate cyclase n=1 Tax=Hydrococcus rivularis NIES-593 TaxID=1921803 RepID=A0A1U7HB40_9CYAN|nr:EAL domain-containing protein [Hydrococcus rivularis]OKH20807.1 diguanylate cyclase [Hydrococcus rivularis NIES-593]
MIAKLFRTIHFLLSTAEKSRRNARKLASSSVIPISSALLASLSIAGLVIGIRQAGILQRTELVAFDAMMQLSPPLPPDPRLLVVGITEDDLRSQNRRPLSDRIIARLLSALQKERPKAIGLDIYRDISYPPGHEKLLEELKANNVIVVTKLEDGDGQRISSPPGVSRDRVGFSNFVLDSDNVLRRNLMYAESNQEKFYSFALQLSLNYLKDGHLSFRATPEALQIGKTSLPRLRENSGGYQMPAAEVSGWQILLKYRSAKQAVRQVTLTDVLNNKVDPTWIENKVVLVGTVAPSGKNQFATPYSTGARNNNFMPGVVIHAQMVSQILATVLDNQRQFWFWAQWGEWLWIWLWSLVGGLLGLRLHHPLHLGAAVAISTGGLWVIGYLAFVQSGWIPVVPPAIAAIAASASVLAYQLFYSNSRDALTGLHNRRAFLQQLQQINRQKRYQNATIAILFLDLDRFKRINDGLGREAGDWLLRNTAKRLQKQLDGKGQQLARVGGDEFAIYLSAIDDEHEATQLADRLQKELTHPFQWQGQDIYTTVSIGIAYNRTGSDFDAEELLREADIAMYQAKELGQARHQIFAAGMRAQAETRWQLETEMRRALARREFQLYYQPIVSLKTLKISGFEALIRWQSPQRGFVSPGLFVPVAEESGLIIPIGQWILREACLQMNCWREQFPQHSSLIMSVNLSRRQFSQVDLVEQIETILADVPIDRDCLKLEITESLMMNDFEEGLALLGRLKALGLRLSLDDFGTGYSSLSNLHTFPIDTLKIDRSFVNRLNEERESHKYAQIVRTIVMLGHNLELDVIAEGIETAHQVRALQSLNCEYGQGYFFSKPLSKEAATKLLASDPQWEV